MSLKSSLSLIGTKRFTPILTASALGTFNDNMFKNALIIMATFSGLTVADLPSETVVPIAATAFTLPLFLFSAISGQIADRYDRATLMRRAKFAEIILMLIAAAGFLLNNGWILILTLFLMGAQSAFYAPSRVSSMPHYLKPEELVAGNALFGAVFFICLLLGQAGGQLLAAMPNGPQIVAGLLIVFAIAGFASIVPTPPSPAANPDLKIRWNFIIETGRIIYFAMQLPQVLRPLLGMAWFYLFTAGLMTLMPLLVREVMGEGAGLVTLFSVLFVIGAATGSLAVGALTKGRDAIIFTVVGGFGLLAINLYIGWQVATWVPTPEPVGAIAFAQNPDNWHLLIAFFASAVFAGLYIVPLQAMAQRRAPIEKRARLLAAGTLLNALGASIGQLGLLALSTFALPIWWVFVFVGVGTGLIAMASMRYVGSPNRPYSPS